MVYEVHWYNAKGDPTTYGSFATSDEIVIDATKNMKWALGMRYSYAENWCNGKRIKIHLVSEKTYVQAPN